MSETYLPVLLVVRNMLNVFEVSIDNLDIGQPNGNENFVESIVTGKQSLHSKETWLNKISTQCGCNKRLIKVKRAIVVSLCIGNVSYDTYHNDLKVHISREHNFIEFI